MGLKKRVGIAGYISAALGSVGAIIGSTGLCACTLIPIFSIAGLANIAGVFLSQAKLFFLVSGMLMLTISIILKEKSRTCRKHRKL